MTITAFPPSITTRPVYGELHPRVGTAHLIVADGEGGGAIGDLMHRADLAGNDLRATAQVIYITGANGTDMFESLRMLGLARFHHAPTRDAALPRLRRILADAHMGIQIYLTGTESLMGVVQTLVEQAGLPFAAVQTEHRGSTSRRVQCVHCKGITENVMIDPFSCSHCGLNLYVRDHYSRRIAAFQGVNIDAEDPGEVPQSEVKFP